MHPPIQIQAQTSVLRDITQWAQQANAINLGQGVCNLPVPQETLDFAEQALRQDWNRYTAPLGLDCLREQVAKRLKEVHQIHHARTESIAITHGSTGAWETICAAWLQPGDEVIVFSPFYPYHRKGVEACGARVVAVELKGPQWTWDKEELIQAFGPRTKLVVLCTPANPTGRMFSRDELEFLGQLCIKHQAWLVSDEVYDFLDYARPHLSPAAVPSIASQCLVMGSFSKTFAITGWRVGYLMAPVEYMPALSSQLDRSYVCAPAPMQKAVADSLAYFGPDYYQQTKAKYLHKKNLFESALSKAGWTCMDAEGAYYLIATPPEGLLQSQGAARALELIERFGVGAVPADDFTALPDTQSTPASWMRFCYSHPDELLQEAAHRLNA